MSVQNKQKTMSDPTQKVQKKSFDYFDYFAPAGNRTPINRLEGGHSNH